jgi:hypothetical protein
VPGTTLRRCLLLSLCALTLALAPLTGWLGPGWVRAVVSPYEDDNAAARQRLRRTCAAIVERYDRWYGDVPYDQWPRSVREVYEVAKRFLAETD